MLRANVFFDIKRLREQMQVRVSMFMHPPVLGGLCVGGLKRLREQQMQVRVSMFMHPPAMVGLCVGVVKRLREQQMQVRACGSVETWSAWGVADPGTDSLLNDPPSPVFTAFLLWGMPAWPGV